MVADGRDGLTYSPTPLFPYSLRLLLLAGNCLGRTLAGARIGVRALAADRQRTTMAQATVAAEVHQALDVHGHLATQIAFDPIVAIDGLADLQNLSVGELVHAALGRDPHLLGDFLGFGLPASAPSLGELTQQAKDNLQAPWLAFTAFFTFAIMLSLLVFIFEGVRDAFDPRKTFK